MRISVPINRILYGWLLVGEGVGEGECPPKIRTLDEGAVIGAGSPLNVLDVHLGFGLSLNLLAGDWKFPEHQYKGNSSVDKDSPTFH